MGVVDLNSDLGESFGAYSLGDDEGMLRHVSSANVACGFHAGDPSVLRRTLRLVTAAGVAVGAHPSFPDLQGFGRRDMSIPPEQVEDLVLYQVAAVAGVARAEGARLRHVKPHGALYNKAALDPLLARAIASAVAAFDTTLFLYAPAGSALEAAGRTAGLRVVREAFADRQYEADGTLTPRLTPGAVLGTNVDVVARAVGMVTRGQVVARTGETIDLQAETLCIHGDTPGATEFASRLGRALRAAGIIVEHPR